MPVNAGSVLLVTPRWARDGGVATHVISSAQALARHGLEVSVLAARIEADPVAGVNLIPAPALFDEQAAPAERLGPGAATRAGTVHIHQVDDPALVAELQRSAPVVMSAHGYPACTAGVHYFRPGHECGRPHGPGCVPRLVSCGHTSDPRSLPGAYRRATRSLAALRLADMAISYSSAVDRHLAVNGIEARRIVPLFTTLPAASGPGDPRPRRVLFAGRVVLPKGIAVLIRAVARIEAELVVCGDGWRLEQMRKLVRKLGIEERVHFRGWLAGEELARELAEASVVAIPSVWPEPFGLGGLEAFAAGRPVVATATGGTGDWLQDGINGLAVPPGNVGALARALDELLGDPDRQRRMAAAGREMAARSFSPERHVAALLGAYEAARAQPGNAARGRSSRLAAAAPAG